MWRLARAHVTNSSASDDDAAGLDRRAMSALPAVAIATVFGCGFSPIWPGTIGALLALPLVYFLGFLDPAIMGVIYLALFLLCGWAAHRAGRIFREPDHRAIVCDETWAMAVVWECTPADLRWMLVSFIVFRLFDAAKPWPISAIDRNLKNGFGVMLDDACAALATILSVFVLHVY